MAMVTYRSKEIQELDAPAGLVDREQGPRVRSCKECSFTLQCAMTGMEMNQRREGKKLHCEGKNTEASLCPIMEVRAKVGFL